MPRSNKSVQEFLEQFPAFARRWFSRMNGFSRRMKIVKVELEPEGIYRFDIVTTKAGERGLRARPAGEECSYYFNPPADPINQSGTFFPDKEFVLNQRKES